MDSSIGIVGTIPTEISRESVVEVQAAVDNAVSWFCEAQETTPPSTDQHHVSLTSQLKEPYKSRSLVQTLSLGRGTLQ
ncbi:agouti-related protein isoform X2 [Pseudorasbora parva]|uniref:agouti-related protein isoform X2 n=1 Tax=Pseudorasbora parva TaxID=51549 RepID=UPI00351EF8A4